MKELIEKLRAAWEGLSERDQRILALGIVVAAPLIFLLAVWGPLALAESSREKRLADAHRVAQRLEDVAAEAQRGGAQGGGTGRSLSLLAAVDQSSRTMLQGKPPSRMQPDGEKQVRVWLDDVPFDALMRWVNDLDAHYGVQVESAEIERRSGAGLVSARITLVRL